MKDERNRRVAIRLWYNEPKSETGQLYAGKILKIDRAQGELKQEQISENVLNIW